MCINQLLPALLVCVVTAVVAANADMSFEEFMFTYNRVYPRDGDEYIRRSRIFDSNAIRIKEHNDAANRGLYTYWLALNQFSDWDEAEWRQYLGTQAKVVPMTRNATLLRRRHYSGQLLRLPDSVDWRTEGAVTGVKNQGRCGSCWSFSTTGSVEGQWFKKSGTLVSLNEQQLVDCSTSYGNHGCNGGLMDYAFEYIKKYGLEKESDYAYTAKKGKCKYDASKVVAHITGYTDVAEGSEEELQAAVASVGPVSVAIDASHFSFQFYHDGVYNEPQCSSTQLDHGVLVVGYGTWEATKQPFWWVKNSWGPGYGVGGYIRMSRNKNNQCGIATAASYPLV